jgi:glyoxylase-like metal-dependent hydrolase (beta-lactamase superfamily II)
LIFIISYRIVSMARVRTRCSFWIAVLLSSFPSTLYGADSIFQVKPVADGVFALIAKPTFRLNCNAAIILMDDSVVVVDSESVPSAAREVIAEIKRLTYKPVKYVVITHFHGDHFQGAQAYRSEWPGVEIISSDSTRESIAGKGIPRMRREVAGLPARIAALRASLQQTSDPGEKKKLYTAIGQAEAYLAELKNNVGVLPTMTVDHSLVLHGKSRTVNILWLGRAHTDGDLFVYVPDARVLASGDALHSGTPTLTDASPYDWVRTLNQAEELDFDYVIGGHGDVMRGKATFELWKQYLTDLMAGAAALSGQAKTLAEARKILGPVLIAKYGDKFGDIPAPFAQTVDVNINCAMRLISGRLVQ